MFRRVHLAVFLGLTSALLLTTGLTAGAAPEDVGAKRGEVATAQERLMQVRQDSAAAQNAYNSALFELNELDGKIEKTESELQGAQKRLAGAQKDLEDRASQVYKSGNVGFMDVLVGVEDFSNFASRMDLWLKLLAEERSEFDRFRQARDELKAKKGQLEVQRAERVETIDAAIARKEAAEKAEAEAESYLNSLSADLQASIQAEQQRRAERARAAAEKLSQEYAAKAAANKSAPVPEPAPIPESVPAPEPQLLAQESDAGQDEARLKELREQRQAELEAQEAAEAAELEAQKAAERQAQIEAQEAAEEAELEAQRRAAERQAAEQRAAELAEAQRQAQLAAEREAAREEARRQAAAQRAAEREAQRLAIEQEAAELAARQAAALAEQQTAEQQALQNQQAQAAEEQYLFSPETGTQAASEAPEVPSRVPEPAEEDGPAKPAPVPQPVPGPTESVVVQGGTVAPHVQEFADEVCRQLAACAISTYAGHQPAPELALDILVSEGWGLYPADTTLGDAAASFAVNNSGAYSIDYVIWGNRIAGSWNGYQWVSYGGYGATGGHYDHVHIGFYY